MIRYLIPLVFVAALAACGKDKPVADNAVAPPANMVGDAGADGLAAPENAGAAEAHDEAALPAPTDGMRWSASAGGTQLDYGPPGASPALSITCARGPARLIVARGSAAPDKGVGTLSLTGAGHVASLPMMAVGGGTDRIWRSEASGDLRSAFEKVFAGTGAVQVTLAGAGDLVVPADPSLARLFAACR